MAIACAEPAALKDSSPYLGSYDSTGGASADYTGGSDGTGGGGSQATGGTPATGGTTANDSCQVSGTKLCGDTCVIPSPTTGCSLDSCDPCPVVENGSMSCVDSACDLQCDDGYVEDMGTCVADISCSDGAQNGTETDVDCGGDCPPCDDGKACELDSDCVDGLLCNGTTGASVCSCEPKTQCDLNVCGTVSDGCGGTLDCGSPKTQCDVNECGMVSDGCGSTLDCGSPKTQCGSNACGTVSDGCGSTLDCGAARDVCPKCGLLQSACCKSDGTCGCQGGLGGSGCN